MKKHLLTLFVAATAMFTLAACSTPSNTEASESAVTSAESAAPTENVAPAETVLVDNDDITVVLTDTDPDDMFGYVLKLRLENKTDKTLMYSAENVSVNGFMVEPLFAQTVSAGNKANADFTIFDTDLEDNQISEVNEVKFSLRAYNDDDSTEDAIFEDELTINP